MALPASSAHATFPVLSLNSWTHLVPGTCAASLWVLCTLSPLSGTHTSHSFLCLPLSSEVLFPDISFLLGGLRYPRMGSQLLCSRLPSMCPSAVESHAFCKPLSSCLWFPLPSSSKCAPRLSSLGTTWEHKEMEALGPHPSPIESESAF